MLRNLFRRNRLVTQREKTVKSYTISVSGSAGNPLQIDIKVGEVVVFLGANGSGKTRLAAAIEENNAPTSPRISAHRALNFPEQISTSEGDFAKKTLYEKPLEAMSIRLSNRSHSSAAGAFGLMDDFTYLLKALYAEHAATAFAFKEAAREGGQPVNEVTKIERLTSV